MKTTLYCACTSNEHQISLESVALKPDEGDGKTDLYLAIHLAQCHPWYGRIIPAIKHIFGYSCKYGNFDEFLFTFETAIVVRNYLDAYLGTRRITTYEYPVEPFSKLTEEELNAKENNNE